MKNILVVFGLILILGMALFLEGTVWKKPDIN